MEQLELNENQKATGGLMALVVMTIIFQSLGILIGLLGYAGLGQPTPGMTKFVTLINPLLCILMLVGAVRMLKLKKSGFNIYMAAKGVMILLTILSFIVTYTYQTNLIRVLMYRFSPDLAKSVEGLMIFILFLTVAFKSIFPIIYFSNRKKFIR